VNSVGQQGQGPEDDAAGNLEDDVSPVGNQGEAKGPAPAPGIRNFPASRLAHGPIVGMARVGSGRLPRRRFGPVAVAMAAILFVTACGQATTSIGPASLEVPEGWRVTNRTSQSIQVADGTTGGGTATEAGTARAVFDVYASSTLDPHDLAEQLRGDNVGVRVEESSFGGHEAVVLSHAGHEGSGRQITVVFPDWQVHLVYRAAFAGDDAAFFSGRSAFMRSLRSISFS
jgi:hypothetical protein